MIDPTSNPDVPRVASATVDTKLKTGRRRPRRGRRLRRAGLAASLLTGSVLAQPPERDAFFGDLHLHTGLSFDAAASGTDTTPDDAYRYGRGEAVEYMGRRVQRRVPLDFLAVTDHAEYLNIAPLAADPNGPFAGTRWSAAIAEVADNTLGFMQIFSGSAFRGTEDPIPEFTTDALIRSNWQIEIDAAERHYEPGTFTTFVAYEWSPMPGGAHLHRNVIFEGPEYPKRPFSALDSQRPEDLWTYVETLRDRGIDSVLIPHNPNLSQGLMFSILDSNGEPMTREYAERRLLNERAVEIAQNKGTSETRPAFSPEDAFADFELMSLPAEQGADPAGGYARKALGRGLAIEARLGINPFRLGLVGSTDFHSGVSSTEEDNFPGGLGRSDDMTDPDRVLNTINPVAGAPATIFSAGALTGIWAERNTRESLFAALKRREVFATSGTRMRVRLFAGFDFDDDLLERPDWADEAYRRGVPMGAALLPGFDRSSLLKLVVQGVRDPAGANLDRVQIVKIWLEAGAARETVVDIVWAGRRTRDPATGSVPPIADTVDLETATFDNATGAPELAAVWTDADFDPAVPAIYYARVLEIPTPRWSTYLAVRNGLPISKDVPATIQERAWSSPIFYTP